MHKLNKIDHIPLSHNSIHADARTTRCLKQPTIDQQRDGFHMTRKRFHKKTDMSVIKENPQFDTWCIRINAILDNQFPKQPEETDSVRQLQLFFAHTFVSFIY